MHPTKRRILGLAGGGLALVLGCGGQESSPAPAQTSPAPTTTTTAPTPAVDAVALAAEAEELFAMRCQTCHGARGAGDGPGSAALTPKPRDLRDEAWQTSVDDAHLSNIIQYGGAAVGLSPTMPGNPDLTSRPELVQALVTLIRELGES